MKIKISYRDSLEHTFQAEIEEEQVDLETWECIVMQLPVLLWSTVEEIKK